jgi:DNA-binding NarL/FixJ family response regulator
VIAAASGEEALQLLGEEPAQLAVLDLTLPGMDGFAVAEELAPDVPVIIVTGDPVAAYARTVGRTERFQVLPKPVAPDLLEHAVTSAL